MRLPEETRLVLHVGGELDGQYRVWEPWEVERERGSEGHLWEYMSLSMYGWPPPRPEYRPKDGVYRETERGVATWFPRVTDEAWQAELDAWDAKYGKPKVKPRPEPPRRKSRTQRWVEWWTDDGDQRRRFLWGTILATLVHGALDILGVPLLFRFAAVVALMFGFYYTWDALLPSRRKPS